MNSPSTGVTWINVEGVHHTDLLKKLGDAYELHPLTVEDILNTNQHPKLEEFDDYLFLVLEKVWPSELPLLFHAEQLSIVIGPSFILTFRESEADVLDSIRERILRGKGRVRSRGPDYLAYALMDMVVGHCFFAPRRSGEKDRVSCGRAPGVKEDQILSILGDCVRAGAWLKSSGPYAALCYWD